MPYVVAALATFFMGITPAHSRFRGHGYDILSLSDSPPKKSLKWLRTVGIIVPVVIMVVYFYAACCQSKRSAVAVAPAPLANRLGEELKLSESDIV